MSVKHHNRTANSVDPDETVSSGSILFAQVAGLVCSAERVKTITKKTTLARRARADSAGSRLTCKPAQSDLGLDSSTETSLDDTLQLKVI